MNRVIEVRARWLWWIDRPPIENAGLIISREGVVESTRPSSRAIDLGDVCILPAFVNAHTHLEFSDLEKPIPHDGSFAGWIANVVVHRRKQQGEISPELFREHRRQAIRRGALESWAAGCGTVVDMITEPWSPDDFLSHSSSLASDPRTQTGWRDEFELFALPEVLGLQPERAQQTLNFARKLCFENAPGDSPSRIHFGVSPHAPYSTPLATVQQAVDFAIQQRLLVSMHLAESREELEWLDNGRGPIADMLTKFVSSPLNFDRGSIQSYLQILATAPKSLVVHGNYLRSEDIELLQRHRDRMAVVFCPRTHAYFGHERHPWRELLAKGISVFLGTDSKASNPDLNVLEEARFLFQSDPSIEPAMLLAMITTAPKTFLASLERPSKRSVASFAMVPSRVTNPSKVGHSILAGNAAASPLSLQIHSD